MHILVFVGILYWYFLVASIMFVWLFLCCPNFPGSCPNLSQPFVIGIRSFVVCLFNCLYVVCKKVFSRILFCLLPISDDPSLPQIPTTLQLTKHSANSFWYPHLCELCRVQFFYNIEHFKQKHKGMKPIVHANLKAIRRLTPMFSSRLKTINLVTPPRALTVGTIRKYLCKKNAIFSKIYHNF